MNAVLIIGCGDVGRRVAALHRANGEPVTALVRSETRAQELQALGIAPWRGDLDDPASLPGVPAADARVYYFAPPPRDGTHDPRVEAFVRALDVSAAVRRVVYISTSGVYGDAHGAWVDEACTACPRTERARRRLAAEDTIARYGASAGVPVAILRVPGIYGPQRLPIERLRRGLPVPLHADSPYTNRIHVDDLARACVAAGDAHAPAGVCNVSDDEPLTVTEYFSRLADWADLPRPPQRDWEALRRELSPAMLSFLEESRRLDNRRMHNDLGVTLRYPDLATGLASCTPPGGSAA